MDTDKGNSMKQPMIDSMIDALQERNDGAVDNGPDYTRARENRMVASDDGFGPVVIKRLPAHKWECDSCGTHGSGWHDIEKHYGRTHHAVYTEMR